GAERIKYFLPHLMAFADKTEFRFHHVADKFLVGAVDDQLDPAFQEIVLQELDIPFQSEKAFRAPFFGKVDEGRHDLGGILAAGGHHLLQNFEDAEDLRDGIVHEKRTKGPPHHDEEGLVVEE